MSLYEAHRCAYCGSVTDKSGAPLTRRQRQLLDFIANSYATYGFAPSFEEIAVAFGYRSLATVHEHLVNLERKGWIRRRYNESRAIELIDEPGLSA